MTEFATFYTSDTPRPVEKMVFQHYLPGLEEVIEAGDDLPIVQVRFVRHGPATNISELIDLITTQPQAIQYESVSDPGLVSEAEQLIDEYVGKEFLPSVVPNLHLDTIHRLTIMYSPKARTTQSAQLATAAILSRNHPFHSVTEYENPYLDTTQQIDPVRSKLEKLKIDPSILSGPDLPFHVKAWINSLYNSLLNKLFKENKKRDPYEEGTYLFETVILEAVRSYYQGGELDEADTQAGFAGEIENTELLNIQANTGNKFEEDVKAQQSVQDVVEGYVHDATLLAILSFLSDAHHLPDIQNLDSIHLNIFRDKIILWKDKQMLGGLQLLSID